MIVAKKPMMPMPIMPATPVMGNQETPQGAARKDTAQAAHSAQALRRNALVRKLQGK